MRVAILGSGPAGLMSAAAAYTGRVIDELTIFSNGGKSDLYGAQYLHMPIPGYTLAPPEEIKYILHGDTHEYRRKVYGPMWDGTVSPDELEESHPAWDIRDTYDALWRDFKSDIAEMDMDPAGMKFLTYGETEWGKFDLIINTIPRPALCAVGHQFRSRQVWAAGEAHDRGIDLDRYHCADSTVLLNSDDVPLWYRLSNIYGYKTVEWPDGNRPVLPGAVHVTKPLSTNCDCWPGVLHVGRYGKWQKGVLTHQAYEEVYGYVSSRA